MTEEKRPAAKRKRVPKPGAQTGRYGKEAGEERRRRFIEALISSGNGDVAFATKAAGVSAATYVKWRHRWPEFGAWVDKIRSDQTPAKPRYPPWEHGFSRFAKTYFGHEFSWFHLLAAQAFEEAEGGDIVMFLWPPEHGKTTLAEDYINYKLGVQPGYRITLGTETGDMGEKMVARVKMRMEPDGPAKMYVDRFGPFIPGSGNARKTIQPWASDHFDVWKKGNHDERDYSMRSLGMRSSVIGTRTDLLIVDDPQSRKTLNSTEYLLGVVRGDWLSRPGTSGHSVFNGSRQGDGDIYEVMQKEGIVDRLIKLPAYDEDRIPVQGTPWLWPERYSERDYLRMKRNAGNDAWERTYLQKDGLSTDMTFTPEMLGECHNPMRAIWHDPPEDVRSIYVTLDPSIGGPNGIAVLGATARKLYILRILSIRGLNSNQAILGAIEELCHEFHTPEHPVTDLIIEDKAFQKGMMEDTALHELIRFFGFRVTGHNTGADKYDENLGVPQMAHSLLREEIDIPWAGDETSSTRREMYEFELEMKKWRPYVRGTKLRQDRVMAFWFGWILWRKRRRMLKAAERVGDGWSFKGLPYKPTKSGLIVAGY